MVLIPSFLLSGCFGGSNNISHGDIVGTWRHVRTNNTELTGVYITLADSGVFTRIPADGSTPGTWSISGNVLTIPVMHSTQSQPTPVRIDGDWTARLSNSNNTLTLNRRVGGSIANQTNIRWVLERV